MFVFTKADVETVRHVVQRVLVPCLFVIGLLGNSVSIYVLTRKRMRCTTNIYLTALAITDIIYLTMALLLSLQHYDYVKRNSEHYWMFYGIMVWLCDACAYISIYIAVCFTIERFIAIRYPLKRQTFCTERLAKIVIASVSFFCLISTLSTAFEHQYASQQKLLDSLGQPCNMTREQTAAELPTDFGSMWQGSGSEPWPQPAETAKANALMQRSVAAKNIPNIATTTTTATAASATAAVDGYAFSEMNLILDAEFLASATPALQMQISTSQQEEEDEAEAGADVAMALRQKVAGSHCHNVTYYAHAPSSLALNELYTSVWGIVTLVLFVILPFCLLGTFNCFLILQVRRSKSLRGEMTNASSMRRTMKRKAHSSVSQENRVTVTLIAVVLFFIICQLPWAIYMIVSVYTSIDGNTAAVLGNILNFLTAINAAANFFLYCVLSDKYRKTVRELISGNKYQRQRHTLTNTSLYYNNNNTIGNGSRRVRPTASSLVIK